jgi:predicted alpha/beta hydrolase family esterase
MRAMANAWGSRWHDLGAVGHLNPASGFGEWPEARTLIGELSMGTVVPEPYDTGLRPLQLASA